MEDFPKNAKCSGGRTRVCKRCTNARQEASRRKRYTDDPEFRRARKQSQRAARARKLGLRSEELQEMLERANGVCEICKQEPNGYGPAGQSLHIDHCHATGRVRGLLCARCNLTLGRVEDSVEILSNMQEYLLTR